MLIWTSIFCGVYIPPKYSDSAVNDPISKIQDGQLFSAYHVLRFQFAYEKNWRFYWSRYTFFRRPNCMIVFIGTRKKLHILLLQQTSIYCFSSLFSVWKKFEGYSCIHETLISRLRAPNYQILDWLAMI
jgi:hypothetical protein